MSENPVETSDDQLRSLERLPGDGPLDETDVSLRAYFARLSDTRLGEYSSTWSADRVMEWDGNFRSDGMLMLVCCERDVDIVEYREVLERHIACRQQKT
jgi:hypothetical protein